LTPNVIIAGGGVIGLSLAWRLLQEKARVTVIDAGARKPSATWAAAGMLAPSFERGGGAVAEPLYRFSAASLKRWRGFAEELEAAAGMSIDCRPFGIIGAAFDEMSAGELEESHDHLALRGANVEWIDGRAARELEPAISQKAIAALYAVDDGQVDARLALIALRRAVARAGGVIIDDAVTRVRSRNGAADAVETLKGATIGADRIVIAAGAAAAAIETGAPTPAVFPVKGEAVALSMRNPLVTRVVRGPGAYLCPKSQGRLVIGATEVPHDETLEPSAPAIDALRRAAAVAAPAVASLAEEERWAGLRPATPDAAPILGTDPRGPEGLVFALGHYRNGVLLAPETAALLAPLIMVGKEAPELDAFRPDRFNPLGVS
jgi:glycine oxidase